MPLIFVPFARPSLVFAHSALCNIGMSCATLPTTSLPCALTLNTLSKNAEYKVKTTVTGLNIAHNHILSYHQIHRIRSQNISSSNSTRPRNRGGDCSGALKAHNRRWKKVGQRAGFCCFEKKLVLSMQGNISKTLRSQPVQPPILTYAEQVTIAEEGCIPAIVTLLRSSEDVPTQYHALMTLCR